MPAQTAWSGRLRTAAWIVLMLGLLRAASLVWLTPMLGYANQYDMLRSQACLQWSPAAATAGAASPEAPLRLYAHSDAELGSCYFSTDVALAAIASPIARSLTSTDGTLDLRGVGLLKWLLLAALAVSAQHVLRDRPPVQLGHAALVALVLCDPANTLFFNTLYTESGALLGSYMILVGVLHYPSRWGTAWLIGGIAAAAASRVPMAVVIALLAPFLVAYLRTRPAPIAWGALATMLVVLWCGAGIALQNQTRFASIAQANRANLLFDAALPAADQPALRLRSLGLDPRCAELSHGSWYDQRGLSLDNTCPDLAQLSRLRLLVQHIRHPEEGVRFVLRGLLLARGWRHDYVGQVEGRAYAMAAVEANWRALSLSPVVASLPFWLWASAWAGAGLLGLWATVQLVMRRGQLSGWIWLQSALSATTCLVLLSSLYGDGYSEIARHLHLGITTLIVQWLCVIPALRHAIPRWRLGAVTLLSVTLAVCAIASQRMSLAYGYLNAPALHAAQPGSAISGWAIDATAIRAVLLRTANDSIALPLSIEPAPEGVHRLYAGIAPSAAVAFRGLVPHADFQIIVENVHGERSVIDQRRVGAPFSLNE